MTPKAKRRLGLGIGLAITAVMLWWSTRGVSWSECREHLGRFNYWWTIPSFVLFYGSMYLRAIRWGLLFKPHYDFDGRRMFPPTMICFAFNSILPGRVGEFVRAVIVGRRMATGIPMAMATVVAERILDALTMLGMMAGALATLPPIPADFKISVGKYTIEAATLEKGKSSLMIVSVILVVGVILFLIPLTQRALMKIIAKAPLLPEALKVKIAGIVRAFHQGFGAFTQPWAMASIVFYSLAIWLLNAASIMVLAWGFDLAMNMGQAITMMTLIGLAIMVPASPGYWGPFEAGGIFSLVLLGVVPAAERSLAFTLTVIIHLLQYVPVVAIGMYFSWRMGVKPAQDDGALAASAAPPAAPQH